MCMVVSRSWSRSASLGIWELRRGRTFVEQASVSACSNGLFVVRILAHHATRETHIGAATS